VPLLPKLLRLQGAISRWFPHNKAPGWPEFGECFGLGIGEAAIGSLQDGPTQGFGQLAVLHNHGYPSEPTQKPANSTSNVEEAEILGIQLLREGGRAG
jgi:hypothetical protein